MQTVIIYTKNNTNIKQNLKQFRNRNKLQITLLLANKKYFYIIILVTLVSVCANRKLTQYFFCL